jgi:hypothetical protein
MDFRIKLRIAWIIALTAMVLVLVWLSAVPGGKITYVQDFKSFNDFIGNLTPVERMAGNKIIGDPVYFSLRVPRRFTSAKLTLKYKVDPSVPIIEAGVLKDRATWQYDLQPIYNGKLDELMKNWNMISNRGTLPASRGASHPSQGGDNLILLQRKKTFISVDDFLKNQPKPDKIALYNYDLKNNFILPDYVPAKATTTMCRPLQGTYQFYTYIKNENLADDFVFEDLNKEVGSDPIDIFVYYNDKQIAAEHLDDDGVADDSGAQKSWRHLKLNLANLPEGVYKIGVRADNDIITRTITTVQSKMAFVNKINLAAVPEVSCGRNLITDSRKIQAQTVYADKLQTIQITPLLSKEGLGGGSVEGLSITELFTQFSTQGDLPKMSYLVLQNDGAMISGDGLFSFSESQFFNPTIRKVDANFDADKEGIDYVLANYVTPARDGDWLVSTAEFDLQNVYKQWNKHSFLISVPGLRAEDNTGDGVTIGEIKIELTGTSFWEKIEKIFNYQFTIFK